MTKLLLPYVTFVVNIYVYPSVEADILVVTTLKIYDEFKAYVAGKGAPYEKWYVGITTDAFHSLFVEHGVSEKQGCWIYKQCINNASAKQVKTTLMRLGCDGRAGGWCQSTNVVYAYLKTPQTTP